MLNAIWLGLVVLAVLLGAASGQLGEVTTAAFDACKTAVMTLALPLAGIMALWLGVMRLAEKSGLVNLLAGALRPIMRWLFPDVPPNHPAMGSMVMNMAANMLGLANAATPLGLRAMQHLEKLNPRPGVATNAMCTFLADQHELDPAHSGDDCRNPLRCGRVQPDFHYRNRFPGDRLLDRGRHHGRQSP